MINSDKKVAKVAKKYICEFCDYITSNKNNYEKHLTTDKHKKQQNMINSDEIMINSDEKVAKVENEKFICLCGKSYKHKRSLWHHKTTCNYEEPICEEIQKSGVSDELVVKILEQNTELLGKIEEKDKKIEEKNKKIEEKDELLLNVVKENQELTKKMVEIAPNIGNNNNNTINNNQRINVNVFLNEECKNALNMSDFLKSIEVSFEQLDLTKRHGLEQGITKVIMDNLNKLSKYERPLHCTDTKRKTLYIKENDKWEKDVDKSQIKKAINKTSNKNYTALINWKKDNPDYMDYDHKQLYYAKAMSKLGKPIEDVEEKIIKNICVGNYIKNEDEDEFV